MRVNYHTHTPRCKHALGDSIFDYAKSAYEHGIEILGMSDHAPFPDFDWGYRMQQEELPDYLADIDRLRQDYAGKMTFYKGVEIEYMPQYLHLRPEECGPQGRKGIEGFTGGNYYEYLLSHYGLDYLLLGEHIFKGSDCDCPFGNGTTFTAPNGATQKAYSIYDLKSDEEILLYAKNCVEAMKTGYFKILAHPDLYCCNAFAWGKAHEEAADQIIETAITTNTILEFNANGLRRGIQSFPDGDRYPYPDDRFWKKVAGSDARVVIGSDSHNPTEIVDWASDLAEKKLAEFGIQPADIIF